MFSSLGYGFVDFESPYAASAAVKQLQGQGMMVQMAKVSFNLQKSVHILYTCLCVCLSKPLSFSWLLLLINFASLSLIFVFFLSVFSFSCHPAPH